MPLKKLQEEAREAENHLRWAEQKLTEAKSEAASNNDKEQLHRELDEKLKTLLAVAYDKVHPIRRFFVDPKNPPLSPEGLRHKERLEGEINVLGYKDEEYLDEQVRRWESRFQYWSKRLGEIQSAIKARGQEGKKENR
jgi:hypothetical protein